MIRNIYIALVLIAACTGPALADTMMVAPAHADASRRIVVPAHDIARGDVIAESDLTFGTVAGTAMMSGTVTTMAAVTGMEARRMLRAGQAVSTNDVRHPVLVTKGQTITMTFEAPGVDLTAMGRALSEGGIGDSVTVQNPASFRMITAVVTGAGTVRATGPIANGSVSNGAPMNQLTARK
jgi:flagella basal body P-ring formation protein FlgA